MRLKGSYTCLRISYQANKISVGHLYKFMTSIVKWEVLISKHFSNQFLKRRPTLTSQSTHSRQGTWNSLLTMNWNPIVLKGKSQKHSQVSSISNRLVRISIQIIRIYSLSALFTSKLIRFWPVRLWSTNRTRFRSLLKLHMPNHTSCLIRNRVIKHRIIRHAIC